MGKYGVYQPNSKSGRPLPGTVCQALCLLAEGDAVWALSSDGDTTKKKAINVPEPTLAVAGQILKIVPSGKIRVIHRNLDLASHFNPVGGLD